MELERAWRERTGDIVFNKQEWKRIPTERFRMTVQSVLGKLIEVYSEREMDWLDNNLYSVPNYERYNPVAIILGFGCIEDRKISIARFQKMEKVWKKNQYWIKSYGVTLMDIIRYARRWEGWYTEKIFSRA